MMSVDNNTNNNTDERARPDYNVADNTNEYSTGGDDISDESGGQCKRVRLSDRNTAALTNVANHKQVNTDNQAAIWSWTVGDPTDEEIEYLKTWTNDCTRLILSSHLDKQGTTLLECRAAFKSKKSWAELKQIMPSADGLRPYKTDSCFLSALALDYTLLIAHDSRVRQVDLKYARAAAARKARRTTKYTWAYEPDEPALQSQFNKDTFVEPLDFTVKKTIVLWGPPGVGKTQYALTHFEKPLLVTDLNDLKHLDSSYDGIIFDNMDFCRRSRLQCKLLVEHTAEAPIYYRHLVARIPEGMRRIFITTVRGGKIFGKHSDDGSIEWRTNFVCSNIPVRDPNEQMKAAAAAYFGAEATAAKK